MERADEHIRELNELLNDADKIINVKNNQTINLLGKTGAGKSTLLCLLSKFPPKVKFDEISGGFQVDFEQSQGSKIVIDNSSTSCTTLPNFKNINNKIYWDCPGFCDNKSVSQEIVNLYCTKRIFESARDYKIILVIEYSSLLIARGKDISEIFKQLVEMFPEQNKLFNSLSIVVTKCSQRRFSSQMFINNLVKMAEENNEFESSRPLIRMLSRASNKVSIFKVPEEESDINDNLREDIEKSIGNSSFTKMEVKNSLLSDKAKWVINNLITFYESDIEAKMNKFAESIFMKFRSEINMNALTNGKLFLDEFTSLHDRKMNINAIESDLYNLSKYFTNSEALINNFKFASSRIDFYNRFRCDVYPPFNIEPLANQLREIKYKLFHLIQKNIPIKKSISPDNYIVMNRIENLDENIMKLSKSHEELKKMIVLMTESIVISQEMNICNMERADIQRNSINENNLNKLKNKLYFLKHYYQTNASSDECLIV